MTLTLELFMKAKNNRIILTTAMGLFLVVGSVSEASAALVGTQTARVTFTLMANAVFGHANESEGLFNGGCTYNNCFVQNGTVTGVVADPTDAGAHIHKSGTTIIQAQYHPDSTGLYVRMADLSDFSLQSLFVNTTNGEGGGNFILYGYADAINDGLLTTEGAVPKGSGGYGSSSDEDGGNQLVLGVDRYIASYVIPNSGFNSTIDFSNLASADTDWGNISAFWLTFQGFNHSPNVNYDDVSFPQFEIRVDDIILGAPVPVPATVWLFASGILGLFGLRSRRAISG
jgi:hypothetical protein